MTRIVRHISTTKLLTQDSEKVEYYTPPEIMNAVHRVLRKIDLDVSSCRKANAMIGAQRYFTKEDNGLNQKWYGKVWMNHPFARGEKACKEKCEKKKCSRRGYCIDKDIPGNDKWINKLVQEYWYGQINEAMCITYASTSEEWFQPLLSFPQCYLKGRTNYLGEDLKPVTGVLKGSVITYLSHRIGRFHNAFSSLGSIMVPYDFAISPICCAKNVF